MIELDYTDEEIQVARNVEKLKQKISRKGYRKYMLHFRNANKGEASHAYQNSDGYSITQFSSPISLH